MPSAWCWQPLDILPHWSSPTPPLAGPSSQDVFCQVPWRNLDSIGKVFCLAAPEDRDDPNPSLCSPTDSVIWGLVQMLWWINQKPQQWLGWLCVQSLHSPSVTSLRSYFLSEPQCPWLCVISRDIFMPWNIVVPWLLGLMCPFVIAEALIPLFHSGASGRVL